MKQNIAPKKDQRQSLSTKIINDLEKTNKKLKNLNIDDIINAELKFE
jgi:hypothetical protein